MEQHSRAERGALVFCNWLVFGLVGIGFLFEGGARDHFTLGAIGVAAIMVGFVGHIIINHVSNTSFSTGETALGLGLFALGSVLFVIAWISRSLTNQDFQIGLLLFASLLVGFLAYIMTRYGVAGAFRTFDVAPSATKRHNMGRDR